MNGRYTKRSMHELNMEISIEIRDWLKEREKAGYSLSDIITMLDVEIFAYEKKK